ncbi:hypothetical protein ACFX13_029468 [Malus domestica]
MGDPQLQDGEWEMIWSSQIVKKDGEIKFVVDILLGLKFCITGTFMKTGSRTYDLTMDDAAIIDGQFGYPVELESKFELRILYSDDKMRIGRGYTKIVFVYLRTDGVEQK